MKRWKKLAAIVLTLLLLVSGCGLFSNNAIVKFDDTHTHEDPKDLAYDERIVLKAEDFGSDLESLANQAAYPDTMVYDEDGNMVGMYDYDEESGFAKGWTSLEDGSYTELSEDEWLDLGKPDASRMIEIPGSVTAAAVVYGNQGETLVAYFYLFLSDAAAKDTVKSAMQDCYGLTMTEDSDTELSCVQEENEITDVFAQEEEYGAAIETKDAAAYAQILQQLYGLREYSGENPYKPYAAHKDPEDLDFDEKIVMTGSGEAAVEEEYTDDISSMTDYVYGKDGDVIAQYTYLECPSKEAADTLQEKYYPNAERVSDTVLLNAVSGQEMQDLITAYKGYNVLKDASLDAYVKMLQETYFTTICK